MSFGQHALAYGLTAGVHLVNQLPYAHRYYAAYKLAKIGMAGIRRLRHPKRFIRRIGEYNHRKNAIHYFGSSASARAHNYRYKHLMPKKPYLKRNANVVKRAHHSARYGAFMHRQVARQGYGSLGRIPGLAAHRVQQFLGSPHQIRMKPKRGLYFHK